MAWKNLTILKGLTAEEKCFAWKVQQDMLPVGSRIHRRNAERRCLTVLENNQKCVQVQTLEHLFMNCEIIYNVYEALKSILDSFLERSVSYNEIIHFCFNHRNKKRLICALWFSVKVMFKIFHDKSHNKTQILRAIIKEMDWNLQLNRKLGSLCEILFLKQTVERCLDVV